MDAARWMSGHWCTALKGAHGRGAGLVELRARRQREPGHWKGCGANASHWSSGHGRKSHGSEECGWSGMKMSGGGGGGGGGRGPFYKTVGQLEGPGKPKSQISPLFRNSSSNFQPAE